MTVLKPKSESISAFVRELIEREYRAREHRTATVEYQQFLRDNPDEQAAMEAWESAPLGDDIRPKKP